MADVKLCSAERDAINAFWLRYFNKVAFERGLITEQQRNKIDSAIQKAHPSPSVHSRG